MRRFSQYMQTIDVECSQVHVTKIINVMGMLLASMFEEKKYYSVEFDQSHLHCCPDLIDSDQHLLIHGREGLRCGQDARVSL